MGGARSKSPEDLGSLFLAEQGVESAADLHTALGASASSSLCRAVAVMGRCWQAGSPRPWAPSIAAADRERNAGRRGRAGSAPAPHGGAPVVAGSPSEAAPPRPPTWCHSHEGHDAGPALSVQLDPVAALGEDQVFRRAGRSSRPSASRGCLPSFAQTARRRPPVRCATFHRLQCLGGGGHQRERCLGNRQISRRGSTGSRRWPEGASARLHGARHGTTTRLEAPRPFAGKHRGQAPPAAARQQLDVVLADARDPLEIAADA